MVSVEELTAIAATATAVASLCALIFVGKQVRVAGAGLRADAAAQERRTQQGRREWTMQFYWSTLQQRAEQLRSVPDARNVSGISRLIQDAQTDPAALASIRVNLSLYELLATGVNAGVLEEALVERFAGTSIVATWKHYAEWIGEQRDRNNDPQQYLELECLASRLLTRSPYADDVVRLRSMAKQVEKMGVHITHATGGNALSNVLLSLNAAAEAVDGKETAKR